MVSVRQSAMQELQKVVLSPYQAVKSWKDRHPGRKAMGLFPMHIAEELVYAAGVLPVFMWESDEPITLAHSHYAPYNCALSRSVIDDSLKGKLAMLDGLLFYDTCMQAKGLPFIVGRNAPPAYLEITYISAFINPQTKKQVRVFNIEQLRRLRQKLEVWTGRKITDDDLRQSIKVYNENKGLLRQVYDMRRRSPWLFTMRDVVTLVWSSMLMDKQEHTPLLREVVREAEAREKKTSPPKEEKPRIVIYGHPCFAPRFAVTDLIQDMGVSVVDDGLFVGGNYIANDSSTQGDPIESLADKYLKPEPVCLTKVDWENHPGDYVARLAKDSRAKGAIQLMVKFCPPHLCCSPDISRRLAKAGIPDIVIETEHELTGLEQTRTKLQAFVESIVS